MSIVNTETGELSNAPSYGDVKESVARALSGLEQAAEQIIWQIENRAWVVLGYADWNEMREAEYGGAAFMVPRAERPELLARMRRTGLTQQEIADTAGVSKATVINDLKVRTDFEDSAPAIITNARGQQRPTSYSRPSLVAPPTAPTADEAVTEFPDLVYYVETGRIDDVPLMATDLRRYRDRGELDERLDTLRRSIALDRAKRDGTYQVGTAAVMNEHGIYEMQPMPQPTAPETCPACGQTVRN